MLDNFGRAYLQLTLEINKHVDGYVDSYLGPADLKASVEATPPKSPTELLTDLNQVRDLMPGDDPERVDYLNAVFRAMDCTIRLLKGETFDYLDEVDRMYDIQPQKVDERLFSDAHRELDTILPGSGKIGERLQAWRRQYEIANEQILQLVALARDEARQRTLSLIDLVEGESMEAALVSDKPWLAYNWYKGNAHSLIEFNVDFPYSALKLADTFAHEGYPGHHTEHQLKDKLLYQEKGYAESASLLLNSPSAIISEGIATTALEIIFPDGSHYDWTAEVLIPAAKLPPTTADQLRRYGSAIKALKYVSGNAALLYHSEEMNEAQTLAYYQEYGLETQNRARQAFSFITHPLFKGYTFTYTHGYDLIAQAAHGDKLPLFKRLLVEEMRPARLAKM